MATSTFDKRDEESKKKGRPKKRSNEEKAQASESGGEAAAKKKPPKKSAAEKAAEQEEKEKQAAKGARKALRRAVKEKVLDESTKIAETLVGKMIEGNMRSTAVVLSMIEKKKKDSDGSERHGGLTAADLLGSEEEWEGETAMENRDQRTEIKD